MDELMTLSDPNTTRQIMARILEERDQAALVAIAAAADDEEYHRRAQPRRVNQYYQPAQRDAELKCYSSVFDQFVTEVQQGRSESGNRARVPTVFLPDQDRAGGATFLQITNQIADIQRVVGVESYTAGDDEIFVPTRVFESLQIGQGEKVRVEEVQLRTATKLTFKPQTDDFFLFQNSKRALELTLANWPCICIGDVVDVCEAELKQSVTVTGIEPMTQELAVSLINTNVEIEFEASELPTNVTTLELDSDVHSIAVPNKFTYFSFTVPADAPQLPLCISIAGSAGNPIIFCSQGQRPTRTLFSWCSAWDGDDKLVIATYEASRPLLIGIVDDHGTDFTIRITFVVPRTASSSSSSSASSVAVVPSGQPHQLGRSVRAVDGGELRPGFVVCDLCSAQVQKISLARHQLHCVKNYVCPLCMKSFPKEQEEEHKRAHCSVCHELLTPEHVHCDQCNDLSPFTPAKLEQHIKVFHTAVPCRCGESFQVRELQQHQSHDCVFRQVVCESCEGVFTQRDLAAHQTTCHPAPEAAVDDEPVREAGTCPYCDCEVEDVLQHVNACPNALLFEGPTGGIPNAEPPSPQLAPVHPDLIPEGDRGQCPICKKTVNGLSRHAGECKESFVDRCPYCRGYFSDLGDHLARSCTQIQG